MAFSTGLERSRMLRWAFSIWRYVGIDQHQRQARRRVSLFGSVRRWHPFAEGPMRTRYGRRRADPKPVAQRRKRLANLAAPRRPARCARARAQTRRRSEPRAAARA